MRHIPTFIHHIGHHSVILNQRDKLQRANVKRHSIFENITRTRNLRLIFRNILTRLSHFHQIPFSGMMFTIIDNLVG